MIEINGRKIGNGYPPYFIAEISGNHNGEKQHALDLISKAKQANADAVKIQTFTPDCLTLNSQKEEFIINGFVALSVCSKNAISADMNKITLTPMIKTSLFLIRSTNIEPIIWQT